jgi:hypothetical protein
MSAAALTCQNWLLEGYPEILVSLSLEVFGNCFLGNTAINPAF